MRWNHWWKSWRKRSTSGPAPASLRSWPVCLSCCFSEPQRRGSCRPKLGAVWVLFILLFCLDVKEKEVESSQQQVRKNPLKWCLGAAHLDTKSFCSEAGGRARLGLEASGPAFFWKSTSSGGFWGHYASPKANALGQVSWHIHRRLFRFFGMSFGHMFTLFCDREVHPQRITVGWMKDLFPLLGW